MEKVLERTWQRYLDFEGYKGERIGYAYSFHMDTDYLHAHVILFPRRENGGELRLSNRDKYNADKDGRPIDHLTNLTIFACQEAEKSKNELFREKGLLNKNLNKHKHAVSMLRSGVTLGAFLRTESTSLYVDLEQRLYEQGDFQKTMNLETFVRYFRGYLGIEKEDEKTDPRKLYEGVERHSDSIQRKLARFWIANHYIRTRTKAKKTNQESDKKEFPNDLRRMFNQFWTNALEKLPDDIWKRRKLRKINN